MNLEDNIKHAIRRLHITTSAETDKRILDDAFSALDRTAGEHVGGCIWQSTLKRKAKDLITVGAVILVVFTLFFCTLSSQAVVLEDINNALGQVRNVCIEMFRAGETKPYQTSWKSRPFRVWMVDDIKYVTLTDLNSWTRMEINRGIIYRTPVEIEYREKIENSMGTSFGLIPFSDMLEAKTKGRWEQIADTDASDEIEVYDLTWSSDISNYITEYYRWRVFVDIRTDLPIKTELYQKNNRDQEYKHVTTTTITYPENSEIETVVENLFGMSLGRLREPEDFSIPQVNQIGANVTR